MSAQGPMQSAEAQSIPRPTRWPLIVLPSNRQDDTNRDAKLINGYLEREMQGDGWVYKRPGMVKFTQPSGGPAIGLGAYNWQGDIYTIFNGHLYKNGVDKGGTIDMSNGVYRFEAMLPTPPDPRPPAAPGDPPNSEWIMYPGKLVFGNGVKAFTYCDEQGLEQITGADGSSGNLPPEAVPFYKGWAFLDETLYVMAPFANIWGSGINNPEEWDPLNIIVARIGPDRGIGLAKQLVYVVAFKENSTEIFYDAANAPPGSPLGRVQGAKLSYGCIGADTVRQMDGALFWLCTNESATVQVIKMENLKAEIISTPAVDRILEGSNFDAVFSWTLKLGGHKWYAITMILNNITLVYDLVSGIWSQWTDHNGDYLPISDSTYNTRTKQTILQHAYNGWLYTMSNSQFTDNGELITVDLFTPNYDAGTMRDKTLPMVHFDASQDSGSILQVRYSDDDYQTWSTFRRVDLGQKKPRLQDLGTFKRRAFNLRHQCDTRFRIKSMDIQMDVGTL